MLSLTLDPSLNAKIKDQRSILQNEEDYFIKLFIEKKLIGMTWFTYKNDTDKEAVNNKEGVNTTLSATKQRDYSINQTKSLSTSEESVEKEANWKHPILDVFKKYNIFLSKINYFKDGTCPVFHVDFKTSPRDKDYTNAYKELLKANYNFPYALKDDKNDLMVNVGWTDEIPSKMDVDISSTDPIPVCDAGSHTMSFKFQMNPNLKKNILSSPYKASMIRRDGKEFVAYLYAEDEKNKQIEYFTSDGQKKITTRTTGNFYIYLYDSTSGKFFSKKIAPFYSLKDFSINADQFDFMVLRHNKKNQSDILLLSDFINSDGNYYEGYGFSEDLSILKKYRFTKKIWSSSIFLGKILPYKNMANAYTIQRGNKVIKDRIEQFVLYVSDVPEEIKINESVIREFDAKIPDLPKHID